MTAVGVVGTGRMGSAIARAIGAAGHDLVVWNRTRGPCDALAAELGCRSAMTAAEVAANSDVTISMLADGAAVELAEGHEMVYRAASGMAQGSLGLRLRRDSSLSGLCMTEGQAIRCDDALTDPRADQAACQRLGIRSILLVPLRHQGEAVGVLKAMSRHASQFDAHDLAVLELLSGLVGAAMYYAARYAPNELFHQATHDGLLQITRQTRLLEKNPALEASVRLRLPYIEPLNLLQIELIKRHRAGEEDSRIGEGILLSINAIATALRNSG